MKRNKFFLASAAITALTLTACTDKDEFSQADLQRAADEAVEGQIQFGTYMGKASTRAWNGTETSNVKADGTTAGKYVGGVIKTEDLQKYAEFGVFAYQTGSAGWTNDTYQADFMYNQYIQAIWNGTSSFKSWEYDPVKYWPNGIDEGNTGNGGNPSKDATEAGVQKLSFFAYAPYTASAAKVNTTYPETAPYGDYPTTKLNKDNVFQTSAYKEPGAIGEQSGIVGMTGWNATTAVAVDPWLNYVLYKTSTNDGVDLLWGLRGQYHYAETDNVPNEVTTLGSG